MEVPAEFADLDLYVVLELEQSVSQSHIRKAYLRRALRTHPDKTGGDDSEFRKVSFAYSILSNESHRKQYDETGKLDFREDAVIADLFSRAFRVEITEDMIEEDRQRYQHSDEERSDLLRLYAKYKGDFDRILESLIHSTLDDSDRLIAILNEAIAKKEIASTPQFKKTTSKRHLQKQRRQASGEAEQVAEEREKLGLDTEAGLAALIQQRQQKRGGLGSLVEQLEAKYSVKKPRKRKAAKTA